jgi:hypothetical protein
MDVHRQTFHKLSDRTWGTTFGAGPRDRLSLLVDPGRESFSILVGDACEGYRPGDWFMTVSVTMSVTLGKRKQRNYVSTSLRTYPAGGSCRSISTTLPILRSEELCVRMCNLTYLHLDRVWTCPRGS